MLKMAFHPKDGLGIFFPAKKVFIMQKEAIVGLKSARNFSHKGPPQTRLNFKLTFGSCFKVALARCHF